MIMRPPYWEIKMGRFTCPYIIVSKIDRWAIRCDHPSNKDKKCIEINCPIKIE